jgi:hypothetical protein
LLFVGVWLSNNADFDETGTIVSCHAHPDDESIAAAARRPGLPSRRSAHGRMVR